MQPAHSPAPYFSLPCSQPKSVLPPTCSQSTAYPHRRAPLINQLILQFSRQLTSRRLTLLRAIAHLASNASGVSKLEILTHRSISFCPQLGWTLSACAQAVVFSQHASSCSNCHPSLHKPSPQPTYRMQGPNLGPPLLARTSSTDTPSNMPPRAHRCRWSCWRRQALGDRYTLPRTNP